MDDVKIALARIDSYLARTAELLSHANAGRELPSHLLLSEEELKNLDQFLDALAARLLKTPWPSEDRWLAPVRFAYRTGYGKHGPYGWLESFYRGLNQAKAFFQPFADASSSGGMVTNYHISIKDVVGPVNVLSKLEDVRQEVINAPALAAGSKEALAGLLAELKKALGSAPAEHAADAELIAEQAEAVVSEFKRTEPRAAALKIKGSGLVEAASALKTVVPAAIEIARKIAEFVANPAA